MSYYRVTPIFRFKSTITNGDPSKVYFFLIVDDKTKENVLIIKTLALTEVPDTYNDNFKVVKTHNKKILLEAEVPIKVDSLNRIMSELINHQLKEEKGE